MAHARLLVAVAVVAFCGFTVGCSSESGSENADAGPTNITPNNANVMTGDTGDNNTADMDTPDPDMGDPDMPPDPDMPGSCGSAKERLQSVTTRPTRVSSAWPTPTAVRVRPCALAIPAWCVPVTPTAWARRRTAAASTDVWSAATTRTARWVSAPTVVASDVRQMRTARWARRCVMPGPAWSAPVMATAVGRLRSAATTSASSVSQTPIAPRRPRFARWGLAPHHVQPTQTAPRRPCRCATRPTDDASSAMTTARVRILARSVPRPTRASIVWRMRTARVDAHCAIPTRTTACAASSTLIATPARCARPATASSARPMPIAAQPSRSVPAAHVRFALPPTVAWTPPPCVTAGPSVLRAWLTPTARRPRPTATPTTSVSDASTTATAPTSNLCVSMRRASSASPIPTAAGERPSVTQTPVSSARTRRAAQVRRRFVWAAHNASNAWLTATVAVPHRCAT